MAPGSRPASAPASKSGSVRCWENAWEEFTPFLRFDTEIRRIVCTTNAIESVNARIRRTVKARGRRYVCKSIKVDRHTYKATISIGILTSAPGP